MSTEVFVVQGMSCSHCERAVTQAVQALEPGARVKVDLASGRVEVTSGLTRDAVAQAIVQEGYTVRS
jgi:copper chaperone